MTRKVSVKQKNIPLRPIVWQFHVGIFGNINLLCNSAVNIDNIQSISTNFHFWTKMRNKHEVCDFLSRSFVLYHRELSYGYFSEKKNRDQSPARQQVKVHRIPMVNSSHWNLPAEQLICRLYRLFHRLRFYSVMQDWLKLLLYTRHLILFQD